MDDRSNIFSAQSQLNNVLKRDEIFTQVLLNFAEHQRNKNTQQQKQKNIFFWMVCGVFVAVVVGCILSIVLIAIKDDKNFADFGVALGSVASLISGILVLPSKIAENLFPAEGEKDFTKFFIDVHKEDMFNDQIKISSVKSELIDDTAYGDLEEFIKEFEKI